MLRRLLVIFCLALAALPLSGQGTPRAADFSVVCDTLTARCNRRFGVLSRVLLERVFVVNDKVDCSFARTLADYPWHKSDVQWFTEEFAAEAQAALRGHQAGRFFTAGGTLEDLITPELTRNGKSPEFEYAVHNSPRIPLVRRSAGQRISRGLSGRHIALWQSHGIYYNEDQDIWRWQRATLHRTVEDMYTQSYVLDYLIPMLENAGAYVMTGVHTAREPTTGLQDEVRVVPSVNGLSVMS